MNYLHSELIKIIATVFSLVSLLLSSFPYSQPQNQEEVNTMRAEWTLSVWFMVVDLCQEGHGYLAGAE